MPPDTRTAGEDFADRWRSVFALDKRSAVNVRAARLAVCTSLPEILPRPVHDGVGIEWFRDIGHLADSSSGRASPAGGPVTGRLEAAVDIAASPVMLADELVTEGRRLAGRTVATRR